MAVWSLSCPSPVLLFLVDLSASGSFGSIKNIKNEVATELCALLAFSAIKNNDKVGLLIFTEDVEHFIPPAKGTTHVLRLIRELLAYEPKKRGTNITAALEYAARVLNRHSIVFLISDFFDRDYERTLRILSRRHDLIAMAVNDPREYELPNIGLLELEDAETGAVVTVDTGSESVRKAYAVAGRRRVEAREKARVQDGPGQREGPRGVRPELRTVLRGGDRSIFVKQPFLQVRSTNNTTSFILFFRVASSFYP